jgi:hypothetical protein
MWMSEKGSGIKTGMKNEKRRQTADGGRRTFVFCPLSCKFICRILFPVFLLLQKWRAPDNNRQVSVFGLPVAIVGAFCLQSLKLDWQTFLNRLFLEK